ncbi:hypothetical protein [Acinetobacter terrestris]|uniref:Uncharacterized protein n=1 Tax=Acinetobacter terrestris TaxID=2529843 RepID=A0AAW6URR6_9GAMM|nr:hypothetical protein [Acinetobacter terrestris]MDK1682961.1 hypothetical protein [Acinetobacter terrestris]
MKMLALLSAGIVASYCYKTVKCNQQKSLKSNFDEIIKQSLLRDFMA